MTSSSSSTRVATINALASVTLTRARGRPTFRTVTKTRSEIALQYAKSKTGLDDFPLGSRFGLACAVMKSAKYIRLHNANCEDGDELEDD